MSAAPRTSPRTPHSGLGQQPRGALGRIAPRRPHMGTQGGASSSRPRAAAAAAPPRAGAAGGAPPPPPLAFTPDGRLPGPTPLADVVADALRRWYQEAERDALRGDVKAQALLGQMLIEGYGCEPDPARGAEWAEKARRRGYRMAGVYCTI